MVKKHVKKKDILVLQKSLKILWELSRKLEKNLQYIKLN